MPPLVAVCSGCLLCYCSSSSNSLLQVKHGEFHSTSLMLPSSWPPRPSESILISLGFYLVELNKSETLSSLCGVVVMVMCVLLTASCFKLLTCVTMMPWPSPGASS